MRVERATGSWVAVLAAFLAVPEPARAHGLVGRADLPIPAWLFAWAAAVVLVISFAGLAVLWQSPRLERDDGFRPLPARLSSMLVNPVTEGFAALTGVTLLVVTLWSGLAGVQSPESNFALTFVYVLFWVGLVPVSVVFGDVFRAFNPWRALGRATGFVAARATRRRHPPLRYPERLGHWPAAAGLLGFTWIELAYSKGDEPSTLALAALIYTAVTLIAMACFGTETWTSRGETFSVYFRLFSRLAPLTLKHGRLGVRRPLSGIVALKPLPGTVAVVTVMIGTVMYDGASEGSPWIEVAPKIERLFADMGFSAQTSLQLAASVGMLIALGIVSAIYAIGVAGMRSMDDRPRVTVARSFVHTLVPIAAVYVLAHYFSLLTYNGQAIVNLSSDPLGKGWDLFGTAGTTIDYGVVGATGIWYVQVCVLIAGHVCGLVLSHDRALASYGRARAAATSQHWMLCVMVAFTTFGLFLLSQANQ